MSKEFNFEEIKNKALEQLKSGKSLFRQRRCFFPVIVTKEQAEVELDGSGT